MAEREAPSRTRLAGMAVLAALAGALALAAALTLLLVLPFTLVLTAFGHGPPGAGWLVYLWAPVAGAASFATVVVGVASTETPRALSVAILLAVATAVFLSFPPFWLAGA